MAAHDSTNSLTPGPSPEGKEETDRLKSDIIAALRKVHDPEIPINIYDLGLIYQLDVTSVGEVKVVMTLTTPNCPVAELIPNQVKKAVESVDGVESATVELTWTPP